MKSYLTVEEFEEQSLADKEEIIRVLKHREDLQETLDAILRLITDQQDRTQMR